MSTKPEPTAIRKWYLDQARDSFASLNKVLGELTEAEVHAALELESASTRRRSIIDRLISRAVRLNELTYKRQLQEKFHGTHPVQRPHLRGSEAAQG